MMMMIQGNGGSCKSDTHVLRSHMHLFKVSLSCGYRLIYRRLAETVNINFTYGDAVWSDI
jgi:hypothetical protein